MKAAEVHVVPWCAGTVLDTSCGGVLQFGIEVLVVVPSCALARAAEVRAVPWQSLVPLRYLSVPLVSVASAALVHVVPEQSLSSFGDGALCAALVC